MARPVYSVNPDVATCSPTRPETLREALEEYERLVIVCALERNRWIREKTAKELGIGREWLWKRMKELGIATTVEKGEECPLSPEML
jgi:DNA-binding NtrC family response regulator